MTSLSLENCVPRKCSFSSGSKHKSGGARTSHCGGWGIDSSSYSVAADISTPEVLGMARYYSAEELRVAAFLGVCFSMLKVHPIKTLYQKVCK